MSARTTKSAERAPRTTKKVPSVRAVDDDTSVFLGRGAEGRALSMGFARALRGRPKKGAVAAGSRSRNVRMQDAEWEALEALATTRGLSVHAAMREALVHWMARAANQDAKKGG